MYLQLPEFSLSIHTAADHFYQVYFYIPEVILYFQINVKNFLQFYHLFRLVLWRIFQKKENCADFLTL